MVDVIWFRSKHLSGRVGSAQPMAQPINRMQFLSGDLRGERAFIRPPWAHAEERFTALCTRCGECMTACPYAIIKPARGKFPVMDFSISGCDFCGDCVTVCKPGALVREDPGVRPWGLKAVITGRCLSLNGVVCRSCGEACEARAIGFRLEVGGIARPKLDLDACTGCGECFAVCPVKAVNISTIDSNDQAA